MKANPIVYTAHHKKGPYVKNDLFQPLHVGRANKPLDKLDEMSFAIGDNTGDHISEENSTHNELSGLYWLWKNAPPEYTHLGFMHYSRHLYLGPNQYISQRKRFYENGSSTTINSNGWTKQNATNLCEQYDVIVPEKWHMHKNHIITDHQRYNNPLSPIEALEKAPGSLSMYHHFKLAHIEEDLEAMLTILKEQFPHLYHQSFNSLREHEARFCNMFLMKREIANEYLNILFTVIEELKKSRDFSTLVYKDKGAYNRGVFGFLSERLFSIYCDWLEANTKVTLKNSIVKYLK